MPKDDELNDQDTDTGQDDPEDELAGEPEPEPVPQQPAPVSLPPVSLPSADPVLERTGRTLRGSPEPGPGRGRNDMSDLFEVPNEDDNDMYVDDLVEVDDDEDLSDLTRVTAEDVMGRPPRVRPRPTQFQRTSRPYDPPTSMGGTR